VPALPEADIVPIPIDLTRINEVYTNHFTFTVRGDDVTVDFYQFQGQTVTVQPNGRQRIEALHKARVIMSTASFVHFADVIAEGASLARRAMAAQAQTPPRSVNVVAHDEAKK
jgi:hypothetical protein